MTAFRNPELTLEERAFQAAEALLEKYTNPHNLILNENSTLEDSYTILITVLYTEELDTEDQLKVVNIIDEMKLLDENK